MAVSLIKIVYEAKHIPSKDKLMILIFTFIYSKLNYGKE